MLKMNEPFEPDSNGGTEAPVVTASLHMWGHGFSPKRFAQSMDFASLGLRFTEANEPGEICVAGPYRGEALDSPGASTHGSGIIRPPAEVQPNRQIWWMFD